ncbi:unnamed protein product [Cuscuta epithymum]|uniref:Retrotransposon gag domain-containing protein n=1 Tax=Cuscuta epithymum TaxID=186058 RepID=A0AAV0F7D1_9ASTE|nr:unnamed protein product [Cuscuta epithymum]
MFRIADLFDEIQQVRQGSSSVTQYFTKLTTLWKELGQFQTLLVCICSTPCSCGVLKKIIKEREDKNIIKFLRGLNDHFAHTRSQIIVLNPMPKITKVFSLILQQEREFGSPLPLNAVNATSFNVMTQNRPKANSSNRGSFSTSRGSSSNTR